MNGSLEEKRGGEAEFLTYLEARLSENAGWDKIARELLDPPDDPVGAGATYFLSSRLTGDRAAQLDVRKALIDTGYHVTPVIDRDYFFAIYFRTPGGVLFEVATNEPGFDRDEDTAHLGEALKIPKQHEHLRAAIEQHLEPLEP